MSSPSHATSNHHFTTVRSEGGLLLPDLLNRITANDPELPGLDPASFHLPSGERLTEATSRGWDQARNHWAEFKAAIADSGATTTGVTETRGQWIIPLLRELGYDDVQFRQAAEIVDERRYGISHRAGSGPLAPPVHIVSHRVTLDALQSVDESAGPRRISPHSLVQEFLNRTDHLWGIVTNGTTLRLLRDNQRLSRAAYLEFDLESMMEGSVYADFVLLYLVLHRTRLPMAAGPQQPDERPEDCLLEQWVVDQEDKGARALDDLRTGVEIAIQSLGQGLLEHPHNHDLRTRLDNGTLSLQEYYRQLLRLIYRLLFLLAAEDRNLLFDLTSDPVVRSRYTDNYSVGRLRQLVPRRRRYDRHDDLWRSLQITFRVLRDITAATTLGIPPLGGGLFDEKSCAAIESSLISNERLLEAIRGLTYVERDGRLHRTNYRDMDVEELGSVYEGLLELQPSLNTSPLPRSGEGPGVRDRSGVGDIPRTFTLGHSGERKSTGSYYTNSGLVQELIRSALDPVIDAALSKGSTPEEQRRQLLDLKVCDPACGSGHFLLAAARRIGGEIARIDSGDTEPDPAVTRHGVRQAIQHCVYGVDFNPLAVDLCKVALWLEAHEPGKPIGFLDHHIRHGNSLVGATMAVMEEGIPTDAFKEVTGDDRTIASGVRKRNTLERKGQMSLTWQVTPLSSETLRTYFAKMEQDDESIDSVEEKERLYTQHRQTREFWRKQITADLWTSAFFWPLRNDEPPPPTHGYWQRLRDDNDLVDYILAARRDELHHKQEYKTVRKARALSRQHPFFHWELEFEDVFRRDDPGFDVILGNPPFVNAIEGGVDERTKLWIRFRFPEIGGTADLANHFLVRSTETLRSGGYLGMVQPRAALNSPALSRFRENRPRDQVPTMLFAPRRSDLFGDAAVFVALIALGPAVVCQFGKGDDATAVDWQMATVESSNWWLAIEIAFGAVPVIGSSRGKRLSESFEVSASMTTGDAYDLKPFLIDSANSSGQKLITTGLIDPGVNFWGLKPCRYLKLDYMFPRVVESTLLTSSLRNRIMRSKRPKILVAGLSSSVECFVDELGEFVGAVSTYSIFHPKNDVQSLQRVCEQLSSEETNRLFRMFLGGNALGGGNITMKKSFLEEFKVEL